MRYAANQQGSSPIPGSPPRAARLAVREAHSAKLRPEGPTLFVAEIVVELSMKKAATKVPVPVLVAFLVAAQKTVTICLLVRAAAAEDRRETRSAVPVEVRALRIEALTASPIAGAGKQTILVTSLIGVGAVLIVAIVVGVVNPRVSVGAVTIPLMLATTVAVLVAITIPVAVTTPAPGAVISAVATRTIAAAPATRTIAAAPATRTAALATRTAALATRTAALATRTAALALAATAPPVLRQDVRRCYRRGKQ
jgi:hypothetical protein